MAFFEGDEGARYFNCFYWRNKDGLVTGMFYELSGKTAYWLSVLYKAISCAAIILFVVELFLPVLLARLNVNERDFVFIIFFIFDSAIVLPLALALVRQRKIFLEKKRVILDKKLSVAVYLCVIFLPVNYTIAMIWRAFFDTPSPLLFFAIIMTVLSMVGAIFRLRQMKKMPSI
ncbi:MULTISPECIES: hypothetical protein [unclassified Duganella]|uniref:hypothetical protein n=1 Tax=unclassified Duganella TaxID=2636909 RepID=UPI0011C0F6CD|nr:MULTISPECIES: hypothetical protein [unclassified Duganella]